jgi:hypothetical protein
MGSVAILHHPVLALLSATDESQGAGENKFRGSDRSGGRSGGAEIGSCGFGSAPRATIATVFVRICASVVIADVDGVIVTG